MILISEFAVPYCGGVGVVVEGSEDGVRIAGGGGGQLDRQSEQQMHKK